MASSATDDLEENLTSIEHNLTSRLQAHQVQYVMAIHKYILSQPVKHGRRSIERAGIRNAPELHRIRSRGEGITIINSRSGVISRLTHLVNSDHKAGHNGPIDSHFVASELGFTDEEWLWLCVPGTYNPWLEITAKSKAEKKSEERVFSEQRTETGSKRKHADDDDDDDDYADDGVHNFPTPPRERKRSKRKHNKDESSDEDSSEESAMLESESEAGAEDATGNAGAPLGEHQQPSYPTPEDLHPTTGLAGDFPIHHNDEPQHSSVKRPRSPVNVLFEGKHHKMPYAMVYEAGGINLDKALAYARAARHGSTSMAGVVAPVENSTAAASTILFDPSLEHPWDKSPDDEPRPEHIDWPTSMPAAPVPPLTLPEIPQDEVLQGLDGKQDTDTLNLADVNNYDPFKYDHSSPVGVMEEMTMNQQFDEQFQALIDYVTDQGPDRPLFEETHEWSRS